MSSILATLAAQSWTLCASIDASSKDSSRDTLYLQKVDRAADEIPSLFFSMAFADDDKIHLIDAPAAVVQSVEDAVEVSLPPILLYRAPVDGQGWCRSRGPRDFAAQPPSRRSRAVTSSS